MTPVVGFLLFLGITLILLGCTVVTGLRAKRKPHLVFVVLSVASLGVTIYYAEKLGELYDLDSAGLRAQVEAAEQGLRINIPATIDLDTAGLLARLQAVEIQRIRIPAEIDLDRSPTAARRAETTS